MQWGSFSSRYDRGPFQMLFERPLREESFSRRANAMRVLLERRVGKGSFSRGAYAIGVLLEQIKIVSSLSKYKF